MAKLRFRHEGSRCDHAGRGRLVYNAIPALMRRLKEILRNEYIGAIAIGFILAQAAGSLINAIAQPIVTYYQLRSRPTSAFATQSVFNWPQILASLTLMLLYVIVAFLLIFWLYRRGKPALPASGKPVAVIPPAK